MAVTNILKVTFFFGDGRYGWSETYYRLLNSGSSIGAGGNGQITPSSLLGTLPDVIKLAQARANMLPTAVSACGITAGGPVGSRPALEYIRVSQVGFPRNTVFYDPQSGDVVNSTALPASVTTNPLTNTTLLADSPADNPYSAIEMEMTLANGLTSRRALSGVPDVNICDQNWSGGSWYQLWKVFAGVLVNGGWGVASSSITANGRSIAGAQPITSITQADALGRPTIGVAVPLDFGTTLTGCPDFRVQIFCYRSMPGNLPNLNGVYRVNLPPGTTAPRGTAMQLSRSFLPLQAFDLGMVMPYSGPGFTGILAATLTRTISKKRGRPFGLQAGRRRVTR